MIKIDKCEKCGYVKPKKTIKEVLIKEDILGKKSFNWDSLKMDWQSILWFFAFIMMMLAVFYGNSEYYQILENPEPFCEYYGYTYINYTNSNQFNDVFLNNIEKIELKNIS